MGRTAFSALTLWSEVQTCILSSWCHCHSLSLASGKSRLVLPFWYRLTRVVHDKRPSNVCVCVLYAGWIVIIFNDALWMNIDGLLQLCVLRSLRMLVMLMMPCMISMAKCCVEKGKLSKKINHFSFMNKSFNVRCNLTKCSTVIVNELSMLLI